MKATSSRRTVPGFVGRVLPAAFAPLEQPWHGAVALTMRHRPLSLLAGRYRLRTPLGHGGMGELWIADHLGLGTEVVVKFISAELSGCPEAAERFAREAAAAAKVNSPHVVKILDYGASPDGAPFIVMEKLEGRDLATYLAERGALPPDAVARVVLQLANALTKAHAARIVHRDIKPANVFVCESERELFVKLLDFGVAKTEASGDAATLTGVCVGTPGYMSPEQILASKQVDHRADLWSLGVLAFHCLTGRKPFDGESAGAVMLAIHTLAIPKPSRHVPSLPAAVDAWFERACAREPDQRFASASELASALSMALALSVDLIAADVQDTSAAASPSPTLSDLRGEDVSLAPSSTFNRPQAPLRRSRSVLMASTFAVVALGGVAYARVVARTPSSHESVPLTQANVAELPAPAPGPAPVVPAEVATVTEHPPEIQNADLGSHVAPRPRPTAPRSPARASTPPSRPSATASSSSPSAASAAADPNDPNLYVMPDERH